MFFGVIQIVILNKTKYIRDTGDTESHLSNVTSHQNMKDRTNISSGGQRVTLVTPILVLLGAASKTASVEQGNLATFHQAKLLY